MFWYIEESSKTELCRYELWESKSVEAKNKIRHLKRKLLRWFNFFKANFPNAYFINLCPEAGMDQDDWPVIGELLFRSCPVCAMAHLSNYRKKTRGPSGCDCCLGVTSPNGISPKLFHQYLVWQFELTLIVVRCFYSPFS